MAGCLGLAVSGGGDSMAMLHLARGLDVRVVTVDHGLRPEAAAEAAAVAAACVGLGLRHDTLHWRWDGVGNLQDAARRGRRTAIAEWARCAGVGAVAMAHTRDDVAETMVMRLARGAGVDGLARMADCWHEKGVMWLRPLLDVSRAELRMVLGEAGLGWAEDPSNDNARFDRVKVRRALGVLQPLGITTQRLAEVAGHLADARDALAAVTDQAADRLLRQIAGAVQFNLHDLASQGAEVRRRLLLRVIDTIAPGPYAPRGPAVQALLARLLEGKAATLGGVRFHQVAGEVWAFREARAVAGLVCKVGEVWDGRWRMAGPAGSEIRALGASLALCPDWRGTGLPRAALLASPSLWLKDRLIAAPHARFWPDSAGIALFDLRQMKQSAISH
jgi:tRNA(Ile)-lysidine synthase